MAADILTTLNANLIADKKLDVVSLLFKKLTTNEERIEFVLSIMAKYKIRTPEMGKEKDYNYAKEMREKGNQKFVASPITSGRCMEALEFYNKSIAFSPCMSKEVSLAYGNRSAVLFKLGKYTECIQDIDKALALEYADNLRAKIHVRKVECLAMLNDPTVDKVRNEVQELLEKMSLDETNKQKLKTKLQAQCKRQQTMNNVHENQENISMQLGERNSEVPCASDALTIKYTKTLGRHIIANREIHPGEPLAIERPYSIILKMGRIYTHCANCLKPYWNLIACDKCVYAMYCSEKCRNLHWEAYHDIECPVFGHLIETDCVMLDLFSLRLTVQGIREFGNMEELKKEMIEIDEWTDPRTKGFSNDGKLYSNKYRSVYGLATNVEKRPVSNIFRRALDACCILYLVATKTTFFGSKMKPDLAKWAKNKEMLLFGSHVLQHQMTVPTNMHDFTGLYGTELVSRGVAALPFCSLFNHSCAPNVSRLSNRDHNFVVFATETIKKGKQLFDNYGSHYAMETRAKRQKKLSEQYFFQCHCVACEENWPLYLSHQSYWYTVSNLHHREIIRAALQKFDEYVALTEKGDVFSKPHMVKDLLQMTEVLCKYATMPCIELCEVVETLKRIYDLTYCSRFEIPTIQ